MTPEEIKAIRESHHWTQIQLAAKLGVSEYTVRRWEKGKNKPLPAFERQLRKLEIKQGGKVK